MELKRRDFLKLFGGISGAAVLGYGLEDVFAVPDALVEQAGKGPGIETWQNTICGLCRAGCGMRVRLVDGIPVYVKGNPLYPVNRGGLCPLGLNALHSLYHPDRLKGPLARKPKTPAGSFEPTTWDEALSMISNKLTELRNSGRSHEVAFLGSDERGLTKRHIERFMESFGSPNYYQFSRAQNNHIPYLLLQGHPKMPAYDILNARLVISFGSNFLEEGYSPVYYTKLYSHHEEQGTRYVQIEPRASLTASNADEWIPLRPGTYGALALGIAYVLIREQMYDENFVRTKTFGFEDWTDTRGVKHVGFKNMVLGNYYPERVSELTGVSSTKILELGREIGNTPESLIIGDGDAIDSTNGTFATMAIHSLNALLGNLERKGGVFFVDDPPFTPAPRVQEDETARRGNRQLRVGDSVSGRFPLNIFSIESFTENILSGNPYPVSVLFIHGGNPLFQTVNQHAFLQALDKIPLVISFDSILNETSEHAHVVLPEHHFMEKWDEVSNVESVGFEHVGLQHPVVSPFYDTRHPADVLLDLSKRLGGRLAQSFPQPSFEEELKFAIGGIYRSGKGAIVSVGTGSLWLQYLQQRGWQIGHYSSFEEFWQRLIDQGGWWNPIRRTKAWSEVFRTRSRRFEFYSQELEYSLTELTRKAGRNGAPQNRELVLNQLNISARGDNVYLPHHEPVPYNADMPLHLITFRVLPVRDGQGAHLPMMQEMFGYSVHRHWQSWAEIHPRTAEQYHIQDGDKILVQSSVGVIKVEVKVTHGVIPNTIAVPFGLGHKSFGRYANGYGVNPNSIMEPAFDSLNGKPALHATKVRITVTA